MIITSTDALNTIWQQKRNVSLSLTHLESIFSLLHLKLNNKQPKQRRSPTYKHVKKYNRFLGNRCTLISFALWTNSLLTPFRLSWKRINSTSVTNNFWQVNLRMVSNYLLEPMISLIGITRKYTPCWKIQTTFMTSFLWQRKLKKGICIKYISLILKKIRNSIYS